MGRPFAAATALAAAMALACGSTACSSCRGSTSSGPAAVPDAAAVAPGQLTPEQAAQVLARVGDRTITLADFEAALEHMDTFDRIRYQAPDRRKELLAEMIDVMLLADEARDKGYDKDPLTEQEIREILRDAMLKKARQGATAPADIPPDQVRAYYDRHRDDFHDPERRRVSAIALATDAAAQPVLEAARKATALQWGDLVRTKSVDASAKSSVPADLAGDLGFCSPPGDPRGTNQRVPEEVRAAVFTVEKVGDVAPASSGPGRAFTSSSSRANPTRTTAPTRRPSARSA